MTYQTYDASIASSGSLAERASDWIAARVRGIGEFFAERGRIAQLAALDLRTLKDIGLTPSEISSVAHNPADPTRLR